MVELAFDAAQRNALEPDLGQAQHFLKLLDEDAEYFAFQTFDDSNDRLPLTSAKHGTLEQHADRLTNLNRNDAYVGLRINRTDGKGQEKENIVAIRTVWQDADRPDVPTNFPLEPHLVVSTSPGKFQRYWFTFTENVDEFDAVQERLVVDWGSDPGAKDRSRVLRLPGFYHRKGEPHMVRIVHESGAQPCTWEQIKQAFPPVEQRSRAQRAVPPPEEFTREIPRIRSALAVLNPDLKYGNGKKLKQGLDRRRHGDSPREQRLRGGF